MSTTSHESYPISEASTKGHFFLRLGRTSLHERDAEYSVPFARVQLVERSTNESRSDVQSTILPSDQFMSFLISDSNTESLVINVGENTNEVLGKVHLPIKKMKPRLTWKIQYVLKKTKAVTGLTESKSSDWIEAVVQYCTDDKISDFIEEKEKMGDRYWTYETALRKLKQEFVEKAQNIFYGNLIQGLKIEDEEKQDGKAKQDGKKGVREGSFKEVEFLEKEQKVFFEKSNLLQKIPTKSTEAGSANDRSTANDGSGNDPSAIDKSISPDDHPMEDQKACMQGGDLRKSTSPKGQAKNSCEQLISYTPTSRNKNGKKLVGEGSPSARSQNHPDSSPCQGLHRGSANKKASGVSVVPKALPKSTFSPEKIHGKHSVQIESPSRTNGNVRSVSRERALGIRSSDQKCPARENTPQKDKYRWGSRSLDLLVNPRIPQKYQIKKREENYTVGNGTSSNIKSDSTLETNFLEPGSGKKTISSSTFSPNLRHVTRANVKDESRPISALTGTGILPISNGNSYTVNNRKGDTRIYPDHNDTGMQQNQEGQSIRDYSNREDQSNNSHSSNVGIIINSMTNLDEGHEEAEEVISEPNNITDDFQQNLEPKYKGFQQPNTDQEGGGFMVREFSHSNSGGHNGNGNSGTLRNNYVSNPVYDTIDQLRDTLQRCEDDKTKMIQQLHVMKTKHQDSLKAEQGRFNEINTMLIEKTEYLEKANFNLDNALQEIVELKSAIHLNEEEIYSLSEKLKVWTVEDSAMQDCRTDVQEHVKKISTLRAELDVSMNQNKDLKTQIERLQDTMTTERERFDGTNESSKSRITELRQTVRENNAAIESYKTEILKLQNEIHKFKQTNTEMNAQKIAQETITKSTLEQVEHLTKQLEDKEGILEEHVKDKNKMAREIGMLEMQVSKLTGDNNDLRKREADLEMLAERKEWQHKLEQVENNSSKLTGNYITELEKDMEIKTRQFDNLTLEHKTFLEKDSKRFMELKSTCDQYKKEKDNAVFENKRLFKELNLVKTELSKLKNVSERLVESERRSIQNKDLADFNFSMQNELSGKLQKAKNEIRDLTLESRNVRQQYENVILSSKTQREEFEVQIENQDIKISQLTSKIKDLQTRKYDPVPNDPIDAVLCRWINGLEPAVPFFRIQQGTYLFGKKHVNVQVNNERPVFRVGGGFLGFEDFLEKYQSEQLEIMLNEENLATNHCYHTLRAHMLGESYVGNTIPNGINSSVTSLGNGSTMSNGISTGGRKTQARRRGF